MFCAMFVCSNSKLIAHSHVLHSFAFILCLVVLHPSCGSNMQNVESAAVLVVTAAIAAAVAISKG